MIKFYYLIITPHQSEVWILVSFLLAWVWTFSFLLVLTLGSSDNFISPKVTFAKAQCSRQLTTSFVDYKVQSVSCSIQWSLQTFDQRLKFEWLFLLHFWCPEIRTFNLKSKFEWLSRRISHRVGEVTYVKNLIFWKRIGAQVLWIIFSYRSILFLVVV